MVFSSISFLYLFLPLTLAVYFLCPKAWRNGVLLVASLMFYAFGEPIYVCLLVLSSLWDYLCSLGIEKHRHDKWAKIFLLASLAGNLGLLGFFKYFDFFVGTINGILGTAIPLTGVPLPIGISFFTFQTMSYTIDVYRGRVKAQRNLATLATFVCLFPQLIAGPIVRYIDVEGELENRDSSVEDVALGIRRFAVGLGKKVIIANSMGQLCTIFRTVDTPTVLFHWMYAVAFCLQIYFDFSGYSDMAIGLGRMFGFKFPENFNYPYVAKSITDFWRRWHMTLGGWFRDYVYIPLGGNRTSKVRWMGNLLIVWGLTGLWHGASWSFVLWGLYFGIILMVEKLFLGKRLEKAGAFVQHIYVIFLVIISFVIFNGTDLATIVSDISGLFGGIPYYNVEAVYYLQSYGVIFALGIFGALPVAKNLHGKVAQWKVMTLLEPLAVAVLLVVVTAYLVDGSFNPFLYFRF
ncbi:MAG: MBOAT family O-acyltransferase [Eubacteriales bacterium]